jgi:hypothetical protein
MCLYHDTTHRAFHRRALAQPPSPGRTPLEREARSIFSSASNSFTCFIRSYIGDGVVPSSHLLHTVHYVPMPHLRYCLLFLTSHTLVDLAAIERILSVAFSCTFTLSHLHLHVWRLNLGVLFKSCPLVFVVAPRRLHQQSNDVYSSVVAAAAWRSLCRYFSRYVHS